MAPYENRATSNYCLEDFNLIFNLTSVKNKQGIIEKMSRKIQK